MGFNKKVLSKAVSELGKAKAPAKPRDIITDPAGQWKYPGQKTRIPGSSITMEGVNYPVWAQPNIGPGSMMQPGQDYNFPDADYVDETPMGRKGGTLKSSKYSSNISATNKLFTKNKLFQKKKSKIFDPNAKFKSGGSKLGPINLNPNPLSHYELNYGFNLPVKEDGGENEDEYMDLTDEEIQAYKEAGYEVDEEPEYEIGGYVQHELVKAQKGKTVKTFNRDIRDQDAQSNTGWSSAPVQKKTVVTTKKTPVTLKEKLNQTPQQAFDNDFKVVTAKENAELKEKTREQNNAFKNQQIPGYKDYGPQSAGSADWFWTLPIAGSAALKAAGSLGAMQLPGLSGVPGATVGNLFNASTIAEGINQTPETIKTWNDVAKGKKNWSDAALETGINLSEFIGAGSGTKSLLQDVSQGTKYLGKNVPVLAQRALINTLRPVVETGLNSQLKYNLLQLRKGKPLSNSAISRLKWMNDAGGMSKTDAELFKKVTHNPDNLFTSEIPEAYRTRNISNFNKNHALAIANDKSKKVINDISNEDFLKTVVKPTGDLAEHVEDINTFNGKYSPLQQKVILKDAKKMGTGQYSRLFNKNIDRLNEIINENNKSGIKYSVESLDPDGKLIFKTHAQTVNGIDIPEGFNNWNTDIMPGKWKGNVKDLASKTYYEAIPGINMRNSSGSVFADRKPVAGTGTYKSINQFLKELNLGRVKPGFNSQTDHSRSLWEKAIKSGKASGFYGNPFTVYGAFHKNGGSTEEWEDELSDDEIEELRRAGYVVEGLD
jgi:hypothetical protein